MIGLEVQEIGLVSGVSKNLGGVGIRALGPSMFLPNNVNHQIC